MVDKSELLNHTVTQSSADNIQYLQSQGEMLVTQGKFEEAIGCMDEALRLKLRLCGDDSNETLDYSKHVTREVIDALKIRYGAGDLEEFVRLLHRLEKAVSQFQPGLVSVELCEIDIALACAYRKLGNLALAKQLTLKALHLSSIYQEAPIDRASLCLCMCAIMSSLKEHEKALKYGKKGAKHAQEDLMREMLEKTADFGDKLTILAVAYHNVAVEEEHLNSSDKALEWFRKAVLLLEKYGTERHMGILGDMRKSLQEAEQTVNHKKPNKPDTAFSQTHRVLQRASAPSSPMRSTRNDPLRRGTSPRLPSPLVLNQAENLQLSRPHPLESSFSGHRTPLEPRLDSEMIRKQAEKEISGGKRVLKQRRNGKIRAESSQRTSPRGEQTEEELEELGGMELSLDKYGEGRVNLARNEVKQFRSNNRQYQRSKAYMSEPTSALHPIPDITISTPASRTTTVLPPLQSPRRTASSLVQPTLQKPHSSLQAQHHDSEPDDQLERYKTKLMVNPTPRADSDQLQTDTETQSQSEMMKPAPIEPGTGRNPDCDEFPVPEPMKNETPEVYEFSESRIRSEPLAESNSEGGDSPDPVQSRQGGSTSFQVHSTSASEVPSTEASGLKKQRTIRSTPARNCSTAATLISPMAESTDCLHTGKSDCDPSDWSDNGVDFVLVYQTMLDITSFGTYAVLLFANRTDLKLSAFPQERGRKFPADLVVSRSESRVKNAGLGPRFYEGVTSHLVLRDELTLDLVSESKVLDSHLVELAIHQEVLNKAATVIQRVYRKHLAESEYQLLKRTYVIQMLAYRGFRILRTEQVYAIEMARTDTGLCIQAVELGSFNSLVLELDSAQIREYSDISDPCRLLLASLRLLDGQLSLFPSPDKQHKAAIIIQKLVRGFLARNSVQRLLVCSTRKLLLQQRKIFDSEVFNIAIFSIGRTIQIESFKVFKQLHLKYKTESIFLDIDKVRAIYGHNAPMEMIVEDIVFRNNQIEHRPRPRAIRDRNLELLTPRALLKHLNETTRSSEARSIIRSSRKLDERMWVVTMSLLGELHNPPKPEDILEFSAFASGAETPLKVRSRVQELAQVVMLPADHIYPIGVIAIKRLLKIVEGALVLDFSAEVPDVNKLATLVQAHVRGFIARRKTPTHLPKSNLLSCQILTLDNESWVLYAYRQPPAILINAVKRHSKETIFIHITDSIFMKFPPALSHKRIIENFIFPKLSLVKDGQGQHLEISDSMMLEEGLFEKHEKKIKVISGTIGETRRKVKLKVNTEKVPSEEATKSNAANRSTKGSAGIWAGNMSEPNSMKSSDGNTSSVLKQAPESATSMMETETPTHIRLVSILQPDDTPTLHQVTEASQESDNSSHLPIVLKNDPNDATHQRRAPIMDLTLPSSVSSSPDSSVSRENKDLLMRAGLELSGTYYVVSIFKEKTGVLIDLVDNVANRSIAKLVEEEETGIGVWTEDYCEELLSRIQLKPGAKGELEIDLKTKETSSQVLYKRSHYISNRFFNVTVSKTVLGIRIEAFDPIHHSTLSLSVPKRIGAQDLFQREITPIINNLQVRTVLGTETLVIDA